LGWISIREIVMADSNDDINFRNLKVIQKADKFKDPPIAFKLSKIHL